MKLKQPVNGGERGKKTMKNEMEILFGSCFRTLAAILVSDRLIDWPVAVTVLRPEIKFGGDDSKR